MTRPLKMPPPHALAHRGQKNPRGETISKLADGNTQRFSSELTEITDLMLSLSF